MIGMGSEGPGSLRSVALSFQRSDASRRPPLETAVFHVGDVTQGGGPVMPEPHEPQSLEHADTSGGLGADKKKKKKDKVRSAWISFFGRILAQVLGAVASIVLGLYVLHQAAVQRNTVPAKAESAPSRVTSPRTPGNLALAVLPLANFSGDPKQDYFADGMTEAIIADLAQVAGLRVISRTSSMQYKSQDKSVPQLARELGVDVIIEGSFVRVGGRVRVTAQLIDAARDEHIWARSYDHPADDVLALQGQIAATIAREVKAALSARLQRRTDDAVPAAQTF
jgi:TolB-like protein